MDRGYNDYDLFAEWAENGIFFVTRFKDNASYVVLGEKDVVGKENILSDQFIEITGPVAFKKSHMPFVRWSSGMKRISESGQSMDFSATILSGIYKERWQIELFFTAIKPNLSIKTFVGTSENALYIQIWTALISILLLKYMQFRSKINWSLSNLVALLRWNLFSHKDLWAWLDNPCGQRNKPPEDSQLLLPFDGFGQHLNMTT